MRLALKQSRNGSMLVMTIIITALVGSVLGSFLVLISTRNQGAMRAMAWNSAIPVLEAGVEEALTHLQLDKANPRANNWTLDAVDGQTIYWKRGVLPDGSMFYVTNVNVTSTTPVIFAAGYVPAPLTPQHYVARLVRVTTTNPPSGFNHAIASVGQIKLSGSAVIDGYDSRVPYGGTNRTASGGIATDSKQSKAIDVGSAHIYGMAITGPGGSVSVAGGSVGDLNWTSGLEPGWTNNNMNVAFQPNAAPSGIDLRPMPTQVGISNITFLTADRSTAVYKVSNFVSNNKLSPMIVTGNCTLWVTGNFNVIGDGYIYIAPGASLQLYVGGAASISGGGIVNGSGLPANFAYYGLPSSTVLNYSGSADFVGTINAPQANVGLSGGSSLFGAIICNTFTSSGSSSVHYDRTLRSEGILVVTSWRELAPPAIPTKDQKPSPGKGSDDQS